MNQTIQSLTQLPPRSERVLGSLEIPIYFLQVTGLTVQAIRGASTPAMCVNASLQLLLRVNTS
jgi:hypothetical protein